MPSRTWPRTFWGRCSLNPNANLSLDTFLALKDSQAQCTGDGLAQLGDLCARHCKELLGLEVRESRQPGAGMGLWTVWPRLAGEPICEYKGTIRRVSKATGPGQGYDGTYAIPLPQPEDNDDHNPTHYVIDASRSTDGFARYINDFALGDPQLRHLHNCLSRPGEDCRPPREPLSLIVEAARKIEAQSELSLPYGNEYWTQEMLESVRLSHTV